MHIINFYAFFVREKRLTEKMLRQTGGSRPRRCPPPLLKKFFCMMTLRWLWTFQSGKVSVYVNTTRGVRSSLFTLHACT